MVTGRDLLYVTFNSLDNFQLLFGTINFNSEPATLFHPVSPCFSYFLIPSHTHSTHMNQASFMFLSSIRAEPANTQSLNILHMWITKK